MQKTSGVSAELEGIFHSEYQKWSQKSYDELIELGSEEEPYFYAIEIEQRTYPIELMFLEVNDEYLHPSLAVTDHKLRKWWKRFPNSWELMLNDWIVYKDGRIDK